MKVPEGFKSGWGLQIHDPSVFSRSQWDGGHQASLTYLVFRLLLAGYFIATEIYFIYYITPSFFFIYLTDLAYTLLVIDACLHAYNAYKMEPKQRAVYQVTWVFMSIAYSVGILVTIFYWIFLFGEESEFPLGFDIQMHVLNSLYIVVSAATMAAPIQLKHMYQPVLFMFLYAVFSIIYWVAGGVDEHGSPYIYPFLYWLHFGTALKYSAIATVGMILAHLIVWGICKLRCRIAHSVIGRIYRVHSVIV
ncbi:unnamed protein product [Darwinula stevensoni]|uniref:Uncharacterized protein n=1 Tax=Darwinula stevensoni TaxID=69355 RepID=A0A7R9A0X4_9CRUS|nr:unnamed protein product [Darwinula stevensoni]CAG0885432.1 unnamed protein product [Darwinula stevensoni]